MFHTLPNSNDGSDKSLLKLWHWWISAQIINNICNYLSVSFTLCWLCSYHFFWGKRPRDFFRMINVHVCVWKTNPCPNVNIISYPLFADADMGRNLSTRGIAIPRAGPKSKHGSFKNSTVFNKSGLSHRINTVLLGHTTAARKSGHSRNCDAISDISFSLRLTLMSSNVRYASVF